MGRKAELLQLINNVRSTGSISIIRRVLSETVEACLPDDPPESGVVSEVIIGEDVAEVIPVVDDTANADGGSAGELVEQEVVPPAQAADPEATPESPSGEAAVVVSEPVSEPVAEPAPETTPAG